MIYKNKLTPVALRNLTRGVRFLGQKKNGVRVYLLDLFTDSLLQSRFITDLLNVCNILDKGLCTHV